MWGVALVLMLGAAAWQRFTGPTYPARPAFSLAGVDHRAKLIRKGITGTDVTVEIVAPAAAESAVLRWRRYPTTDDWTDVPMVRTDGGIFAGSIPSQPPAGKIEYAVILAGGEETVRVPAGEETVVLRFKGHVPLLVLIPHVVMMFLSILLGIRAGLAALFCPREVRPLALAALAGLTLGGLFLGPVAQKYAFGEFWTGFPYGYDLTDNKLLVLWLVWAAAVGVLGLRPNRRERAGRVAVGIGAIVLLVVYLIPHSARGSELDYGKLREGVSERDAIKTGRLVGDDAGDR